MAATLYLYMESPLKETEVNQEPDYTLGLLYAQGLLADPKLAHLDELINEIADKDLQIAIIQEIMKVFLTQK